MVFFEWDFRVLAGERMTTEGLSLVQRYNSKTFPTTIYNHWAHRDRGNPKSSFTITHPPTDVVPVEPLGSVGVVYGPQTEPHLPYLEL